MGSVKGLFLLPRGFLGPSEFVASLRFVRTADHLVID